MAKNLLQQVLMKPADENLDVKGLVEKIESGYLKEHESKFRKKKSFSPSALAWGSGACPRYWYIAFGGALFESDATPFSAANMKNGTLSHERIQQAMKDSGVLVEAEIAVENNDPPIFGYVDAVVRWNGIDYPAEIKTMREESFQYRKNSGIPAAYHVVQFIIYLRLLKKKRGFLIYESKNTHELLVLQVDLNEQYEAWLDKAFEWMRTVKSAFDNKTLPQKPYRSNSKVCKTCPVQAACKELPKGELKISPLEDIEK